MQSVHTIFYLRFPWDCNVHNNKGIKGSGLKTFTWTLNSRKDQIKWCSWEVVIETGLLKAFLHIHGSENLKSSTTQTNL